MISSGWEQCKRSLSAAGSQGKLKPFQNTSGALRNHIVLARPMATLSEQGTKSLLKGALKLHKLVGNRSKKSVPQRCRAAIKAVFEVGDWGAARSDGVGEQGPCCTQK